jgi:hypothetical protein
MGWLGINQGEMQMENIGNWKIGVVVREKGFGKKYGYIVGLTRNIHSELLPVIRFEGEEKSRGVHPGNLEIVACD